MNTKQRYWLMKNFEGGQISLGDYQRKLTDRLARKNIATPALDCRLLIGAVTGFDHAGLVINHERVVSVKEHERIKALIARRLAGEPVSKILNRKEFYGRDFFVNQDVLDPRPDTETLIDVVKTLFKHSSEPVTILDLGTGSGAIIVTLLCELENSVGVATDISKNALIVAEKNAKKHQVEDRLLLNQGEWFEGLEGKFDLVVSNPPYIKSDTIGTLAREVRTYDPLIALDGGDDGLMAYRVLSARGADFLNQNGVICVEIGFDQAKAVVGLFEAEGFGKHAAVEKVTRDLARLDRVVTLVKQ